MTDRDDDPYHDLGGHRRRNPPRHPTNELANALDDHEYPLDWTPEQRLTHYWRHVRAIADKPQ